MSSSVPRRGDRRSRTIMVATNASPVEKTTCPICGSERDGEKPLLLPVSDAAYLLGICERFVWDLVEAGDLTAVTLGRRVLVLRSSIDEMISRRLAENYGRTARKRRDKATGMAAGEE